MTRGNPIAAPLAVLAACAVLAGLAPSARAQPKCQLQKVAELPVLNDRGSPRVAAVINGHPVQMIVDSGAAMTMLLTSAAQDLHLPLVQGPNGFKMYGVGGETEVRDTVVDRFDFGGASIKNLRLLVAGDHSSHDAAGLLGWDLLSNWDIEFDLPHHTIRLLRPVGCHGDDVMYWSETYHRVAIDPLTGEHPHINLDVTLNHRDVRAILDSGASSSIVTTEAAKHAGATLTSVKDAAFGLGAKATTTVMATFDVFEIGGEEVHNIHLAVGDIFADDTYTETGSMVHHQQTWTSEMLLGADFLRAHRVLVAPDQNRLYFTYEGGSVFDIPSAVKSAPMPATR